MAVVVEAGLDCNVGGLLRGCLQQPGSSIDTDMQQVLARRATEEPAELPVKLAARQAGCFRQSIKVRSLGIALVHHFHGTREPAQCRRRPAQSAHFPPDTRKSDHPAPLIAQGNFAVDDQGVAATLGCRTDCVDDRLAGEHHLFILLAVERDAVVLKELCADLADGLGLGADAADFRCPTVVHDKAALPVLDKKRHVRQQVEELLERPEVGHTAKELFLDGNRIYAGQIHKVDADVQAKTGRSI